jgi:hypothetical protein
MSLIRCSQSFVFLHRPPTSEPQIPNFTAENMPADGESPTQDGDADGESHLADGDSPRKNAADAADGDFPNSKIIAGSALAIHAAGYQPFDSLIVHNPKPQTQNTNHAWGRRIA